MAYHNALLKHHPDKSKIISESIDIALLKDAYQTLSSSDLRLEYDEKRGASKGKSSMPRPAQVISLEEFEEREDGSWYHVCRCGGGGYMITETQMEAGSHLVGCDSCSEVIWVGYELAEDSE